MLQRTRKPSCLQSNPKKRKPARNVMFDTANIQYIDPSIDEEYLTSVLHSTDIRRSLQ